MKMKIKEEVRNGFFFYAFFQIHVTNQNSLTIYKVNKERGESECLVKNVCSIELVKIKTPISAINFVSRL